MCWLGSDLGQATWANTLTYQFPVFCQFGRGLIELKNATSLVGVPQ